MEIEDEVKKTAGEVLKDLRTTDVLVYNTAIIARKNVVEFTAKEWVKTMKVGVNGI